MGSPESGDGAKAPAERTIVISWTVDIQGVNELITNLTAAQTALLYFSLFMPLLEEQSDYEKGPSTFKPRLAESYEVSEDRKQITFHLRPGLVWSDGVPITAEDVRWTWEMQVHPDIVWNYADAKQRITDVEVLDEHTVRFHFSEASATQLYDILQGVILPKHAWSALPPSEWRANPQWFIDHLVVSGPFTLESWDPQQRYVLRRNERYFEEGLPWADRVVYQITPDPATQLALLRSGQAHLIEWIRPTDATVVKDHPDLDLYSVMPRQYVFVSWNLLRPLFADREVRRALTMAIDRQAIIDSLYHGYAWPSNSPFISNSWVYNHELDLLPYDPVKAKQILAKKGWRDTDGDGVLDRDGQAFRFELLTNADNDLRRDILVILQEQLRRVGIDAQPRTLEFNLLIARELAHDYDASVGSVGVDTSLNLSYLFHSRAIDDGYNWGSFSDPEVDRLLDLLEKQTDFLEAKPLYDAVQSKIYEEQPLTFLYEPLRLIGARKTLRHVDPNAISTYFNLRHWQIVEQGAEAE